MANFEQSFAILGNLAQNVSRTPPSVDDQPFKFIDRGLMIIGRNLEAQDIKMEQEFFKQQKFIASELRDADKRWGKSMDERFQHFEKKMEERFQRVDERFQHVEERFQAIEKKMEERFQHVDERFQHVDERFQHVDERFQHLEKKMDDAHSEIRSEIRSLKIQLDNSTAMTRNGRLRRMHQPINLVKTLKPISHTENFAWTTPRSMPKHMKNVYNLGQHAQGIFEGAWEGKTDKEKLEAKRKALDIIRELAEFYQITVLSDDASESDATEAMLEDLTVDQYMELLLDEWGMDWQKICRMGKQHMQSQTEHIELKRAGDTSIQVERLVKQYKGGEGG